MTFEGGHQHTTGNKILVIGACALDRLLHVPSYPKEDGKILCKATFEYGERSITQYPAKQEDVFVMMMTVYTQKSIYDDLS